MRVASIVGARPQFIKAAAISRAIQDHNAKKKDPAVEHQVIHTGQHFDPEMSDAFFSELLSGLPVQPLGEQSDPKWRQVGVMAKRIGEALRAYGPDMALVFGDTDTTVAAAIAAKNLGIPTAHVEAGARCWSVTMREELNRVITDHLVDLLLCATPNAAENLRLETVPGQIIVVGDLMLDVLYTMLKQVGSQRGLLKKYGLGERGFCLATIHRAENVDTPDRLRPILDAIAQLAGSGLPVVLPLHPRTRVRLQELEQSTSGSEWSPDEVSLISPVPYSEILGLTRHAKVVITDSGGLQKEAYWLGVPCVTLREETEWPETLHLGWNVLAGADRRLILEAALRSAPAEKPNLDEFGDGAAGQRTLEAVTRWRAS